MGLTTIATMGDALRFLGSNTEEAFAANVIMNWSSNVAARVKTIARLVERGFRVRIGNDISVIVVERFWEGKGWQSTSGGFELLDNAQTNIDLPFHGDEFDD